MLHGRTFFASTCVKILFAVTAAKEADLAGVLKYVLS